MNTRTKLLSLIGLVLVLCGVWFFFHMHMPALQTQSVSSTPSYTFATDPYPGFPVDLAPGKASSTQFWQSTNQTGALFVVDGTMKNVASAYETQLSGKGWSIRAVSTTTVQISFSAIKTVAGNSQYATVLISSLPINKVDAVSIAVRLQK